MLVLLLLVVLRLVVSELAHYASKLCNSRPSSKGHRFRCGRWEQREAAIGITIRASCISSYVGVGRSDGREQKRRLALLLMLLLLVSAHR